MAFDYEKYRDDIPVSDRKWPDKLPPINIIDLIGFCVENEVSVEIQPDFMNRWIRILMRSVKEDVWAFQIITEHDLISCVNPTGFVQLILDKLLGDINKSLEDE